MKSLVVSEPGRFGVQEVATPEPGPYQALMKVETMALCNATDRKLVEGHFPGMETYPMVLGHENAGIVVKVGEKVTLPSATAYKNGELLTKYNDLTDRYDQVNVVVFVICPNTRRERTVRTDAGNYTYTFTQKGEHTIVYVVYDENGNSAEQRITVKVS